LYIPSPQFYIFGYGLDLESMKKFWIGSGSQNLYIRTPLLYRSRSVRVDSGRSLTIFENRTEPELIFQRKSRNRSGAGVIFQWEVSLFIFDYYYCRLFFAKHIM